MKFTSTRTRVSTAGTRVQLSNVTDRVRYIKVSARTGNSGVVYFGGSGVSSTVGYELSANDSLELNFGEQGGTVALSTFWADSSATNQDLDWVAITED
jgi:hypothetical protein